MCLRSTELFEFPCKAACLFGRSILLGFDKFSILTNTGIFLDFFYYAD